MIQNNINGLREIYSYDEDFDIIEDIQRRET